MNNELLTWTMSPFDPRISTTEASKLRYPILTVSFHTGVMTSETRIQVPFNPDTSD